MSLQPELSSLHNPLVKYARSLHQRKVRYRERVLLVEGVRLVLDALSTGAEPTVTFVDRERLGDQIDVVLAVLDPARVRVVTSAVLDTIAETQTPQGVVAIFPFPELRLDLHARTNPLVLVADGIQDPGNLGTLIRSAVGAGAACLLVTGSTVDPFAPKVIRAGMGAQFRLPIARLDWHNPEILLQHCPQRLSASADAADEYTDIDWSAGSAVVIGNEARGISPESAPVLTGSVAIPLRGGLESLNAGVAGSVILFEAARQRSAKST
jgi:TrmH family RNA methyltransferase